MPPKYSIVIPAYNEGARLAASLEKVLSYIHAEDWNAEIIVVNDGSRDNTAEIIRAFAAKDQIVRLVENPGNRGKGYSVRTEYSTPEARYSSSATLTCLRRSKNRLSF